MPRDWNTVSESGSSSDQDVKDQPKDSKKQQVQSKNTEQHSVPEKQSPHQKQQQPQKREDTRERPKFISDQQLIQKIKSQELDERRKIKIVNCKSQQLVETLKNHKLITYFKDIKIGDKPTFYIASFKTEQDLIAFIQEKMANRYRFFLHPYIKSARDIEREEKFKQRKEDDDKQKDRYNTRTKERDIPREVTREVTRVYDDGKKRGRNRPEYDDYSEEEKKQVKKQKQPEPKEQREKKNASQTIIPKPALDTKSSLQAQKPQPKPTSSMIIPQKTIQEKPKTSLPQFNYQIQKNTIRIHSNIYSKNRIVDDVVYRRMADKWDRIKVYVRKDGLDKVYELAELIYEKIGYGLKTIPDQNSKQDWVEVVLENKCHVVHPNLQYGLLTGNSKKYFERLNSKNKYLISNEFWIQEYVKEFKNNQQAICKRWKEWIVKAQGDNVPLLLRLYWRLKKELYLNANLKVGTRKDTPFAILEIQPETDKDKRPKPDTSVVNNYLTN